MSEARGFIIRSTRIGIQSQAYFQYNLVFDLQLSDKFRFLIIAVINHCAFNEKILVSAITLNSVYCMIPWRPLIFHGYFFAVIIGFIKIEML